MEQAAHCKIFMNVFRFHQGWLVVPILARGYLPWLGGTYPRPGGT